MPCPGAGQTPVQSVRVAPGERHGLQGARQTRGEGQSGTPPDQLFTSLSAPLHGAALQSLNTGSGPSFGVVNVTAAGALHPTLSSEQAQTACAQGRAETHVHAPAGGCRSSVCVPDSCTRPCFPTISSHQGFSTQELGGGPDADELRAEPLGRDARGARYFFLAVGQEDCRLYREEPPPRARRGRKPSGRSDAPKWAVVCSSIEVRAARRASPFCEASCMVAALVARPSLTHARRGWAASRGAR